MTNSKGRKLIFSIIRYGFLCIAALVSVFPLLWMFISATNLSVDVITGKLSFGTSLMTNYQNAIATTDLWNCMWNSFKNAFVLTIPSVIICSMAGYGFEVFHDKAKDNVMKVLMLSMMVPFAAIMIPLYAWFGQMGLVNTTLGFALPTFATVFLIFLFRQSARTFPYEIVEAARIEGMGEVGIFFKIFMPIMKSTYAAGITVTFMAAWNSYLWPLVILQSPDSRTMPLLISSFTAGYTIDYGVLMLVVSVSTIPTIILFFVLQKHFAEGITGAVK